MGWNRAGEKTHVWNESEVAVRKCWGRGRERIGINRVGAKQQGQRESRHNSRKLPCCPETCFGFFSSGSSYWLKTQTHITL